MREKATKICKGYGFIEVADETHALNAIGYLNGTMIGDRELSLNIVREEVPKPAPLYHKPKRTTDDERPKRPRRPRL